jgi:hypothetical protein
MGVMELLGNIGVLFGASWASGINLYLTVAGLGLAHRLEWVALPGDMAAISHPAVIIVASLLFLIEFFADKIPYVDSTWDSIHTFIRPVAGAGLGFMVMGDAGPAMRILGTLLAACIAMDSHLTKATARAIINTSPEPVSNSVASVTEDVSVVGVLYLIIKHPVVATIVVILFVLISIWFLRRMLKFSKKIFKSLVRKKSLRAETEAP